MGLGIFSSSSDDDKERAERGRKEGTRAVTGPWYEWDGPVDARHSDPIIDKAYRKAKKKAEKAAEKAAEQKGWWS